MNGLYSGVSPLNSPFGGAGGSAGGGRGAPGAPGLPPPSNAQVTAANVYQAMQATSYQNWQTTAVNDGLMAGMGAYRRAGRAVGGVLTVG